VTVLSLAVSLFVFILAEAGSAWVKFNYYDYNRFIGVVLDLEYGTSIMFLGELLFFIVPAIEADFLLAF